MGFSYDLAGQLIEQTKPRSTYDYIPGYDEDRTTFTSDLDGLMMSTVEPRGSVPGADPADYTTTATYDADERPVTSTDPLGRTVTTGYDLTGRPVSVTDPAGKTTTTAYNKLGWLVSVKSPGSGATKYKYDKVGNLTKRIDSLGRATNYEFDAANRQVSQTDPLGRVTSMSYDAVGNVTGVVKPSGTATAGDPADGTVSFTYDELNRPVATSFSDTTPGFTYDYTPAGRVTTAARVQGSTTVASSVLTYDDAGRVVAAVNTGAVDSDANYAYSSAGRLSGASWSTGLSATYGYNAVGALTKITPSGVGAVPAVDYAYDAAGRVSSITRNSASPVVTSVGYDTAGQVESLQHASGGTVLKGYDVTRDVVGNPTQVTTTSSGVQSSALLRYDRADRLKFECYPTVGESCTGKSPRNTYSYDKVGNRTGETSRTVVGNTATTVVTNSVFDAGDQLLSQSEGGTVSLTNTWTPNGELASSTTTAGTQSYDTDLSGELVSTTLTDGTVVGYTHDARGNRTSRSVEGALDVSWSWDDLGALPVRTGEYDNTGTLNTGWLPDVTSGTAAPLAETTGGITSWMLTDPMANITGAVTTGATALSGTRSLGVFGNERSSATGTLVDSGFGFSGQYLDSVTGLYDMRARDYDPNTGRFNAQDPVQVPVGMPYFASYVYGNNNPLMFVDPSGLTACGPIGSDCNGANLVPEFRRLERALNDTAYLNLYQSLTEEQANEIPFGDLSYIHSEAANRQMHQMACEASPGECWAPCPEQDYQRCQIERGVFFFGVYVAAPMALGMGASALLGRACAADAAVAARTTAANTGARLAQDVAVNPLAPPSPRVEPVSRARVAQQCAAGRHSRTSTRSH